MSHLLNSLHREPVGLVIAALLALALSLPVLATAPALPPLAAAAPELA